MKIHLQDKKLKAPEKYFLISSLPTKPPKVPHGKNETKNSPPGDFEVPEIIIAN